MSGAGATVVTEQKINRLAAQLAELKHEIEKLRSGSVVRQSTEAPRAIQSAPAVGWAHSDREAQTWPAIPEARTPLRLAPERLVGP